MGRLLTEPWVLATIIVVALLLFSAPKLPLMARSLGQSMRILKSEVREFKQDLPDPTDMSDAAKAVREEFKENN